MSRRISLGNLTPKQIRRLARKASAKANKKKTLEAQAKAFSEESDRVLKQYKKDEMTRRRAKTEKGRAGR